MSWTDMYWMFYWAEGDSVMLESLDFLSFWKMGLFINFRYLTFIIYL